MSKMINEAQLIKTLGITPEVDEYAQAVCSKQTAYYIANRLFHEGACAFTLSVGDMTAFKMVFVDMQQALAVPAIDSRMMWTGGGKVYVSIEGLRSYAFVRNGELHPSYVEEKLGKVGKTCIGNITTLLNDVFDCLEVLSTNTK